MTRAAILCIMAFRAVGTDVSRVVLILEIRDLICQIIVTGAATFLPFKTLHTFFILKVMVASDAGFIHIFTDMLFVVKSHQAAIRLKFHRFGQGRHHATRRLKGKALLNVAGIAGDLHRHLLVTIDAIGSNKALMGWVFALGFPCLSKIVAGTTVHFIVCLGAPFLIIVMAIGAVGKGGMVSVIENHITSSGVKPHLFGGIRGPGKRIPHDAYNHTGDQDGDGKNLFGFVKHAYPFQDQNP